MRVKVTEQEVFTYPELSDAAKEKAREKFSQWDWEDGSMQERMQDLADSILDEAGFEGAGDLTYSLYSQGGYPVFSTRSKERMFVEPKVKGVRRKRYTVLVSTRALGGSNYATEVELVMPDGYEIEDNESVRRAAKDLLESLSQKIYRAMVKEDEYMQSDEVVAERCEANGYEFTVEGELV